MEGPGLEQGDEFKRFLNQSSEERPGVGNKGSRRGGKKDSASVVKRATG